MTNLRRTWKEKVILILSTVLMAVLLTAAAPVDGKKKKKKNNNGPVGFMVKCEVGHKKKAQKPVLLFVREVPTGIQFCHDKLRGQVRGVQPVFKRRI